MRAARVHGEARLEASYRPAGPVNEAEPGSFDHFMAERYCLYTQDEERRLLRADIQHRPWPLQPATVEIARNTMTTPYGLDLPGEPRAHYAKSLDVLIWSLEEHGDRWQPEQR